MPENVPEFLPELLNRLVDLAAAAIASPGLWYAAAVAGFVSISLPFVRRMYGVREHEKSRRHIADHVANGRLSSEAAGVLLGEGARAGLSAEGFRTAGWTLGPLGAVMGIAGLWLGLAVHRGFFAMALGGAMSMALSLSLIAVASAKRKTRETAAVAVLSKPSQPLEIEALSENPTNAVASVSTVTED